MDRRGLLRALAASAALLTAGTAAAPPTAAATAPGSWTTQTLEAFADTLIPGERRFPGDLAVAGAVTGPGAVQAGALQLLSSPDLPEIAALLDARALARAVTHLLVLPPGRPPFVGLPFGHRTDLLRSLYGADDPDLPVWQTLGLLVGLAFDTAAHLHTVAAATGGHPGLAWIGFPPPGPDGLWRFPDHSYNRVLSDLHPHTTASGSPA